MAFLSLQGVVAGYGFGDVLKGVDLELEAGTVTCLIGPNGAGKSTVLKLVSGLLKPRQGTVLFEGKEIGGLSPRALLQLGIAHVPQERSLFPLMTVWENMLMGGYALRDRSGVRGRAEAISEQFPLVRERRTAKAGSLSGGEQKIVEIARALMLEPKLMLMDEPSIGLSPKARTLVFETIGELNAGGWTILLVEQNARSGLAVADRGAVLDGGVVKLVGTGSELLHDERVAELYLGVAGANRALVP